MSRILLTIGVKDKVSRFCGRPRRSGSAQEARQAAAAAGSILSCAAATAADHLAVGARRCHRRRARGGDQIAVRCIVHGSRGRHGRRVKQGLVERLLLTNKSESRAVERLRRTRLMEGHLRLARGRRWLHKVQGRNGNISQLASMAKPVRSGRVAESQRRGIHGSQNRQRHTQGRRGPRDKAKMIGPRTGGSQAW